MVIRKITARANTSETSVITKGTRITPGAAAFGLKRVFCAPDGFAEAAGFDFSLAPPSRLHPLPPHQLDFDPAVQRVRNPNQRANRQIARLILHRRNLRRAHFRLRRQFCLAEILLRPQLRDLHPQLQILKLALNQLSQLRILHLFLIEPLPPCRHFFLPSSRRPCSSIRSSAMRMSSSGSFALRFTMPCRTTNTLLPSPQ